MVIKLNSSGEKLKKVDNKEYFVHDDDEKSSGNEKLVNILEIIEENEPIGAGKISDKLKNKGFSLKEPTVRYHLRILEERGFTKKLRYGGRILTPLGHEELKKALVRVRIGDTLYQIERYMSNTTFDPTTGNGDIVISQIIIKKSQLKNAIILMRKTFEKGILLSPHYKLDHLPNGLVKISVVSATTYDGVFLKSGILTYPLYSGILEIKDFKPFRFTDVLSYTSTSFKNLGTLFANFELNSPSLLEDGSGCIYVTYREIPSVSLEKVTTILEQMASHDFNGLIKIGKTGKSIYGLPISPNRIGVVIIGSFTIIAIFKEGGISICENPAIAMENLKDMEKLS